MRLPVAAAVCSLLFSSLAGAQEQPPPSSAPPQTVPQAGDPEVPPRLGPAPHVEFDPHHATGPDTDAPTRPARRREVQPDPYGGSSSTPLYAPSAGEPPPPPPSRPAPPPAAATTGANGQQPAPTQSYAPPTASDSMPAPAYWPAPTNARPVKKGHALEAVRGSERDPVEDLLVRSQEGVSFGTLLDELLDELIHQLGTEDRKPLVPLAIRRVKVSPNLRQSVGEALEAKLVARVAKLPDFEVTVCLECRTVRSRVEGEDWVVTVGAATQADLRRIARDIGAHTFMDVDITFNQIPPELTLSAKIYRASDAHVLWSSSIRGDETTAAVLRTGKVPPSRAEQIAELKNKLEQRPYFGYMPFLGGMYIQADGNHGGYFGLNIGIRLMERFGENRRHAYGLQAEGIIDWDQAHQLYAGMIQVGYWYSILPPNLNRPELRIGGTGGGFIAGSEGNSVIFQVMAELLLRYRFTFNIGALYMVPTMYNGENLGGLGVAARFALSW